MAWLDSRIWCHPKLARVGKPARWSYVAALAYSDGFGTGGHLERGQLRIIECETRERKALIEAGLWIDDSQGGIWITGWNDHNADRDKKREQARERKRRERAKTEEMSRKQERDVTRDKSVTNSVTSRARPMTGEEVTDEGLTTKAAAEVKSTSSSLEANSAADEQTDNPENPAAAVEGATESEILEACKRFGAEPNIAEPWARQLTGAELAAIALKMEMKIRRGTVESPPGHFVDLLKRQVRANVKAATAVTIRIPTLEETLHADVVAYARGRHPWDVAQDLLSRKMAKLDVPAERQAELIDELHRAYDDHEQAA